MAGWFPLFALSGNNNKAQINLGSADITSQTFINLFNASLIGYSSGATPAALDSDGYPVRNFSGVITGQPYYVDTTLSTTGPWVLTWPAGRTYFKIIFFKAGNASITVNSGTCTLTNASGSGNLTISNTSGAGSVTITWNDTTAPQWQIDGSFGSGYTGNTTGTIGLVRASDLAAFNAGTYFTPEFVSLVSGLHPRTIRPLGWNMARGGAQDTNESKWAYRRSPAALSFVSDGFPQGARAGGASAFGTISYSSSTGLYTSAASDDTTAGAWVNGDTIVGTNSAQSDAAQVSGAVSNGGNVQLTVGSTTGMVAGNTVAVANVQGTTEANGRHTILTVDSVTQITINVPFVNTYSVSTFAFVGYQRLSIAGKTGTKLILNNVGAAIGFGVGNADQANVLAGNAVYVYDAVLDAALYTSGGISQTWVPLEAQIQLANALSCNFWYNSPTWATDDYVTQSANLVYSNLNNSLKLYYEYSNEVWNFGQPAAPFAAARAAVLGLPANNDYYALRMRQINGNLLPASSWSAAMGRLNRLYMFHLCFDPNDIGDAISFMEGTSLVSPGNAAYQAFVGGSAVNYNVAPNRPIDCSTTTGFAPYMAGLGLSGQAVDLGQIAPTTYDAPLLQSIANNWTGVAGGTQAAAIVLIDDAIRQGRTRVQNVTASGTTFTTPVAHNFVVNEYLRFDVTGGTTYANINPQKMYMVLASPAPTATTFAVQEFTSNTTTGIAVNAGAAGSGTTTVGSCGDRGTGGLAGQTLFNMVNTQFTGREALAAYFDPSRPAAGLPSLGVEWYEGAVEVTAPTTAQCFAIGVTLAGDATGATAAAAIAAAVLAWKFDPLASLTIQAYYKAFMGTDPAWISYGAMPHSVATSNLVFMGGGNYALIDNLSVTSPSKYKLYDGFAAFSGS